MRSASTVGRLTYYAAGPRSRKANGRRLLLIHSINAAGSAYEIKPLYEHYRQSRTVYALELPGFGHSERCKRKYSVRMMTDAILIAATRNSGCSRPRPDRRAGGVAVVGISRARRD